MRRELSFASDVWMFGVCLWQLLGLQMGLPFLHIAAKPKQLREHVEGRDPKDAVPLHWGTSSSV